MVDCKPRLYKICITWRKFSFNPLYNTFIAVLKTTPTSIRVVENYFIPLVELKEEFRDSFNTGAAIPKSTIKVEDVNPVLVYQAFHNK